MQHIFPFKNVVHITLKETLPNILYENVTYFFIQETEIFKW